MRSKLIAGGLAALSAVLFSGCATGIDYLWKQGGYLLRYTSGTQSIDSILQKQDTPPDTRTFLLSVKAIKSFAVKTVGLKDNGNYTRYKAIDRDYMVNVVQACDAVSFQPYLWTYPILGKLPYKGFYEPEDAKTEADRLKNLGYDVIVRKADAFSTLGFRSDPLYSFMKRYSPFALASLIIHEQTHATLFLKSQPQWNEELATFVGDEGAFEYLSETYGRESEPYGDALSQKADSELFVSFLAELSKALTEVYSSADTRELKLERKAEVIARFKQRYKEDYVPRFHGADYKAAVDLPLNNAFISLYDLYNTDVPLLERYFARECGSDLKRFMHRIEELARKPGGMKEKLEQELSSAD